MTDLVTRFVASEIDITADYSVQISPSDEDANGNTSSVRSVKVVTAPGDGVL